MLRRWLCWPSVAVDAVGATSTAGPAFSTDNQQDSDTQSSTIHHMEIQNFTQSVAYQVHRNQLLGPESFQRPAAMGVTQFAKVKITRRLASLHTIR